MLESIECIYFLWRSFKNSNSLHDVAGSKDRLPHPPTPPIPHLRGRPPTNNRGNTRRRRILCPNFFNRDFSVNFWCLFLDQKGGLKTCSTHKASPSFFSSRFFPILPALPLSILSPIRGVDPLSPLRPCLCTITPYKREEILLIGKCQRKYRRRPVGGSDVLKVGDPRFHFFVKNSA